MILMYLSILTILLILAALVLGFKDIVLQFIKKEYYYILKYIRLFKKIFNLGFVFFKAFKNLKYSQSLIIEFIFQSFVYFYENTLNEIENIWAFESEYFPQGKANLYEIYKWIKKIRVSNYEEFKNLILSENDFSIIIENQKFEDFTFKVKSNGIIEIIPLIHKESNKEIKNNYFQLKFLKLQNSLFELDLEKARYILTNYKFFGI